MSLWVLKAGKGWYLPTYSCSYFPLLQWALTTDCSSFRACPSALGRDPSWAALGHLYASVVCPWAAGITCSTAVFSALLKYIFTEVPLAWLVVGSDLSCGEVVVERTGIGWNHWNVLILALELSPQRLSCRSSCQTSPRTPNRKIINFCCFLLTASRFLGAAYSFFKGFKYTKLLSLIQILFVEPGKKFYCCCTEIRNNHSWF